MKLRITGGELEAEVIKGSLNIDDIRELLLKQANAEDEETKDKIKTAEKTADNKKPSNKYMGELPIKRKMPI